MRKKTMDLLELVGLADSANELATSLPYGKQRKLEIARALASEPKLLLLDEPAAGMNPQDQGGQNGTVPQPRRTRRATSANANWNNYDAGAQGTDSYFGRQPISAEGYGSYGGYGY